MDKSFFRGHSITRGFSSAEIDRLAVVLEERRLAAGEKICTGGAMTAGLFIVREGTIGIANRDPSGAEQRIATLAAPTVLGELELITGQPAFATAIAEEPVVAYLLTHVAYEGLVNKGDSLVAKLTRNIARVVIERLVESNARIINLLYK